MRSLRTLALYRTEGAVSFIEDISPSKESYSKYPRITVIVSLGANGKNEALVDHNQPFPQGKKSRDALKKLLIVLSAQDI